MTTLTAPIVDSPTYQAKYRSVMDYDLSSVSRWLQRQHPRMDVENAEKRFKKFMYLISVTDYPLTIPSDAVDEYMHAAMIHSKIYHDFCHDIVGRYIHHQPEEGRDQNVVQQGHKELAELSRLHFGRVPFAFNLNQYDCKCEPGNC